MEILIKDIYYSSSSECKKVRIDRYRAVLSNGSEILVKMLNWLDKPIVQVLRHTDYYANVNAYENRNPYSGNTYINYDVILFGQPNEKGVVTVDYSYILTKVATRINGIPQQNVTREDLQIKRRPNDDVVNDLPF